MALMNSFENSFEHDVHEGLTAFPKYLSSKYFYDKKGDALFQQIMASPEYYVTNAEREVFEQNAQLIAESFIAKGDSFDLIELGAGDGTKTQILLEALLKKKADFSYLPIDISENALSGLHARLNIELPVLKVKVKQGEYFGVLNELNALSDRRKIVLFLGSNIGNFNVGKGVSFLAELNNKLSAGDALFVGMDQKKDPDVVRAAYNDKEGVTAAFNKNLLTIINNELGGDFDLNKFLHYPVYNPETGAAKSYLVSTENQMVNIGKINLDVYFKAWESIQMEISQKYDSETASLMAHNSGFTITEQFSDRRKYFTNYLFKK